MRRLPYRRDRLAPSHNILWSYRTLRAHIQLTEVGAEQGGQVVTLAAVKSSVEVRQAPFQVRGSLQTVLSLRLLAPDAPNFLPLLLDKIAHSPDFFRNAPLVLDVGALLDGPPLDFGRLVAELRQQRLMPVGIQNGSRRAFAIETENASAADKSCGGAQRRRERSNRAQTRTGSP